MKKRLIFVVGILLGFSVGAQVNIGVLPTPKQVELQDGVLLYNDGLEVKYDTMKLAVAENPDQAYQIDISKSGITVTASTDDGFKYAQLTLQQLKNIYCKEHLCELPCMRILDWPSYQYRGWLDDISRGPVPTWRYMEFQQNFLELFKMNFYNYYTEHTLYNPEFPDIAPNDSKPKYDGIMANLQCFAHFEKTLRIPYYHNLMDTRYNVNPGNEETYIFLEKQIRNTLGNYPNAQFFNINCDETEGLGSGLGKAYVEDVGADNAYCNHINKVYGIVQKCAGKDMPVLMWGDIVAKNPQMLYRLPSKMQYIIWSYVAQESYKDMLAPFVQIHQQQGNSFWVAPGVSHWSSIPQVENYIQNIAYLARDGYQSGAIGLMNTAWDDSGESLFGDCLHAMLWAAEMAWNPIQNTDPIQAKKELVVRRAAFDQNFDRIYNQFINENAYSSSEAIAKVGSLCDNKWVGDWINTNALMQPLLEFYPSNTDAAILERCDSVESIVKNILSTFDSAALPHQAYACHRILCVAEKSRLRAMLYQKHPQAESYAQRYFNHLHNLKLEYLRLWDEECTQYSRDIICQRYDHLGEEVLQIPQSVKFTAINDGRNQFVQLETYSGNEPIYYTLDGRKPSKGSPIYTSPIPIRQSCLIKTVCYNSSNEPVYNEKYVLSHKGLGHIKALNTEYSTYKDTYSGGGEKALCDGRLGSDVNYADGNWQGYWGNDIDVVFDFEKTIEIHTITMRFIQNTFDWVLAPRDIDVFISKNGKDWKLAKSASFNPEFRQSGNIINTDTFSNLDLKCRYLRVLVHNPGKLPDWHPAKGWDSYMFLDEIVVE